MKKFLLQFLFGCSCGLMPMTATALPGTALRFNGTNANASVAHAAALDAFPLTVTAWVHCLTNNGAYQTIVSKYANVSYDGWALQISPSGQLRGFYYHSGNGAIDNSAGTGPVITDGLWHHAALVVDYSGGRLYLDGTLLVSNAWLTGAGAITNRQPVVFSGLNNGSSPLNGDVDEATIWSRALTANEINYLKHRQLRGVEDGLVSYWKFDEGLGNFANDTTANHFNATLSNSPAWVPSGAAVDLNMIPTNCLKFSGTAGIATIPNAADLDPYPFTATAWFRTTNTAASPTVIAAKYADATYNGWSLTLQGGQLRGFFYSQGVLGNHAIDATVGPLVADGGWHHAALVVDDTGGKIYLDGSLLTSSNWAGTKGGTTATAPVSFGALTNASPRNYPFLGDVDEVTLWSRALSASEIPAQMNLPHTGSEANLVGYWKLDESIGSTTFSDSSASQSHPGALTGAVAFTGSTAYLGDGATHLIPSLDYANLTRPFAIANSPAQSAFPENVGFTFSRIYDYGAAPATETISAILDYGLQTGGGRAIPLTQNETIFSSSIGAQAAAAPRTNNAANGWLASAQVLSATPGGVILDSVDNLHQIVTTLSHNENGGAVISDSTNTPAATRLFHFDGDLYCGAQLTLFNNLATTPGISNIFAGDHLDCSLAVSANAGTIPGTAWTFGNGSPIYVSLLTNGDCILKSGTITANGPTNDTDTIQNISFQRSGVTLGTNGAAAVITLDLPVGLGVRLNTDGTRLMTNTLLFAAQLDSTLWPVTNVLAAPPVPLTFNSEILPCWLTTAQFSWRVYDGQLVIPVSGLQFVRQFEDDVLTANQSLLTDTNAANRISNDAYFRGAQPAGNFIVTADTNGLAQISGSVALAPPELRPHFPYTDTLPGSQISTGTGALTFQNNLIDAQNSYLGVNGAVPLLYSQDCTDTNCSGATAGLAATMLTPPANQLSFTPDGGLLAYGPVVTPSDPNGVALKWGFNGNGVYAQQTSEVGNGVYEIAGNFLRGNQTTLPSSQSAVALLFTGWGDETNTSYVERPLTPEYLNNGFANYAGLNLRRPAQASSYIANTPTGWYPLRPSAKYYARNGGVSGILEAASFPTNFSLYGYNFSFTNYLLSYLDSGNWESRTDGHITFPSQPAGFDIGFERMKFVCSGGLDSAQLPPNTGSKHLNYWDADFTPQSIQFKLSAAEQCSTSPRTLVLGAELHLPFITEAMHGTLGFKASGNLSTVTDNVLGTDSRFALPANLSLHGGGTNIYPVAVASEGYFNNWETPGHPDAGFFTFAGKIRVPFFESFKAQLQVTPNPYDMNNAAIAIAGGWPLTGSGTNYGWSVNGSNYFNMTKFDATSDGWPRNVPLSSYLNSISQQFHPRVQRNWKNLIFFDYPISWDSTLLNFEGFAPGSVSLPILNVGSNLKTLSADKVDFDFNQDLNLGLPHIKALDFVSDTIDGPFNSISNAIYQELKGTADATGLTKGLQTLQSVLNQDAHGFFNPILDPAFANIANAVVTNLAALQSANPTNPALVLNGVYAAMGNVNSQFQSAIAAINGTANQANSVFGQLNSVYSGVDDTIGLLLRMLETDASGNRHVLRVIVEKLVEDQSQALGEIFEDQADSLDGALNDALADYESDLEGIQDDLTNLRSQAADAHNDILSATGPISGALNSITNETVSIQQFEQQAAATVSNYLATVVTATGDYFTANPAAARAAVLRQIEDAFIGSALTGEYQTKFRQFVGDDDFILNQLLCVLTDKINRVVRESVENYITDGDQDGNYNPMKGIGQMQQNLLTAKLRGQPQFNGDTLEMIHLDADLELMLPDALKYNAYIEVRNLDSQSSPVACVQNGTSAAEVIVGANRVPLGFPGLDSSGIFVTCNGRWVIENGAVTGLGGLLELEGKQDFGGFELRRVGATFAFGNTDNYFSGSADALVFIGPVPVDLNAGIFAGQACSLDPLLYVDTNAPAILGGQSSFNGVYVKFGGGISLSDLLLGTSSCLLNADARVTYNEFSYGSWFSSAQAFGYFQHMDVDLSLLCVLSGGFGYGVGGVAQRNGNEFGLELTGSGDVCGSVGPCPFCVQGCKTVTIKGVLKTSGIDYYLDY